MTCTNCSAEIAEGKKFCSKCGTAAPAHSPLSAFDSGLPTPLPPLSASNPEAPTHQTCPHCQSELPLALTACFHCGSILQPPSAPAPKLINTESSTQPPPIQYTAPQPITQAAKPKSGRIAGIAAAAVVLLLGLAVGGHFMGYYTLPLLPERATQESARVGYGREDEDLENGRGEALSAPRDSEQPQSEGDGIDGGTAQAQGDGIDGGDAQTQGDGIDGGTAQAQGDGIDGGAAQEQGNGIEEDSLYTISAQWKQTAYNSALNWYMYYIQQLPDRIEQYEGYWDSVYYAYSISLYDAGFDAPFMIVTDHSYDFMVEETWLIDINNASVRAIAFAQWIEPYINTVTGARDLFSATSHSGGTYSETYFYKYTEGVWLQESYYYITGGGQFFYDDATGEYGEGFEEAERLLNEKLRDYVSMPYENISSITFEYYKNGEQVHWSQIGPQLVAYFNDYDGIYWDNT